MSIILQCPQHRDYIADIPPSPPCGKCQWLYDLTRRLLVSGGIEREMEKEEHAKA
jgi:hypothetical protein